MAGLFDLLSSDPYSGQGLQLQGLFGGLQSLGAGLAQAGQMRPVDQPGPSYADAFLGFGRGQQRGLLAAREMAAANRQQRRLGLLEEAQSDKPDAEISAAARPIRAAFSTLSPEIRALVEPEQMSGLLVSRETQRQRPMTAAELQSAGYRPGSVVMVNDFSGAPHMVQQSDLLSPESMAQKLRIQAAGQAPPAPLVLGPGQIAYTRDGRQIAAGPSARADPFTLAPGQTRYGPDGQPIATGEDKQQPVTEGNAWNTILKLAPAAQAGTLDPNTTEGRAYIAAQTVLTQPRPVQITRPDGSVEQVMQTPQFPFPRFAMGQAPGGSPGMAGGGITVKPPAPLTESQGNATMFYNRMVDAEKRLKDIESGGYTPGNLTDNLAGRAGIPGNYVLSPQAQQYKQATMDWLTAVLRKESGAAITEQEYARDFPKYFPVPGDWPQAIAQKIDARASALRGLTAATGYGAERMDKDRPNNATPTVTPSAPRITTQDQFMQLPSGSSFIDPDGNLRVKP